MAGSCASAGNAGPTQRPHEARSHETGLAAALERARLGSAMEQPSSPSCGVIQPRRPDPLLVAGNHLPSCWIIPPPARPGCWVPPADTQVLTGLNAAPRGLRGPPGHGHAPREVTSPAVPGQELCLLPPRPATPAGSWHEGLGQLCSCFEGKAQPHAAAVQCGAPGHASVVRHGLLKSDATGAAVSQFLAANVPGLVFPSAFLAACKLAARAWRCSSLPCVRACVRFFLPPRAQL